MSVEVRSLAGEDVGVVRSIDRSEHVETEFAVVEGRLVQRPATIGDIPPWDPTGRGSHSVAAQLEFCAACLADGGELLAAFEDGDVLGVAVVDVAFDPPLAWLAYLHVSRPHRRRGVAAELWTAAVRAALAAGADALYVSATPTGSAVGFYLDQGCRLADPVHPLLYEREPDDIHLICDLR